MVKQINLDLQQLLSSRVAFLIVDLIVDGVDYFLMNIYYANAEHVQIYAFNNLLNLLDNVIIN